MSHLLLSETFDNFSFIEGEIVTFNTFHIDGYVHSEFYPDENDLPEYSLWKNVKGYCYSVIRGRQTPLSFRFVFSLSPDNISRLVRQSAPGITPQDVKGLYLNIHFDGSRLSCVTGTSFNTFIMDKTLEHTWDQMLQKFFLQKNIPFEIDS